MSLKQLGVAPPKGFRDLLPAETLIRDKLLHTIVDTYRSYGFERVETPVVEDIRRLKHSEGGENLGLMFKIMKRGDKLDLEAGKVDIDNLVDLGLRYDLTVPVARYFASNKAQLLPVFKSIQVGSVWRAERPQKDRYRQFTQCDIDIFGGRAPADEIELITVTLETLNKLGIEGVTVRVNDRRLLSEMVVYAGIDSDLTARALVNLDKIDKVGFDGVREAFIRDGFDATQVDTFIDSAREIAKAPKNLQLEAVRQSFGRGVAPEILEEISTIVECANELQKGANTVVYDPFLVRGMGYYTGPVFEIEAEGVSGSIAGGGRYDNLIGKLSGFESSACGFSIGFERIVSLLEQRGSVGLTNDQHKVAVVYNSEYKDIASVVRAVQELQNSGYVASMYIAPKNMRHFIERLRGAGYTDLVWVKDGQAGEMSSILSPA